MRTVKGIIIYFLLLCFTLVASGGCLHTTAGERRVKYIEAHPGLSGAQKDLLLKGKLWTGMKPEEVTASLGMPTSVSKDMLGEKEVWTYIYRDQFATRHNYKFERLLRVEFYEGRLANWRED